MSSSSSSGISLKLLGLGDSIERVVKEERRASAEEEAACGSSRGQLLISAQVSRAQTTHLHHLTTLMLQL